MSDERTGDPAEVLWHPTTMRRAKGIVGRGRLQEGDLTNAVPALTRSRAVAAHFAMAAAGGGDSDDPDDRMPVLLRIDAVGTVGDGATFERTGDGAGWVDGWTLAGSVDLRWIGAIETVEPHETYRGSRTPPFTVPNLGDGDVWTFVYTNWRGETDERTVSGPITTRIGATPWHQVDQWLMRAYDLDRKAWRDYAMGDVVRRG